MSKIKYDRGKNPNSHKRSEESKLKTSKSLKKTHKEKEWGFKKGMTPWNNNMKGFRAGIPRHDYNKEFRKKISITSQGRIPWNKDITKSDDWRLEKLSVNMTLKNPMKNLEIKRKVSITAQGVTKDEWKGFISGDYDKVKDFRNEVRIRDNFKCLECGKKQSKKAFHVHHINYDNNHLVEECVTLCNSCHSKTNWNRKYWKKHFKEKLSKLYNYKYSWEDKTWEIPVSHVTVL